MNTIRTITARELAEQFTLVVDEFDVKNVAEAGARIIKYINSRGTGMSVKQAKEAMLDAQASAENMEAARAALGRGMNFQQAVNFVTHGW